MQPGCSSSQGGAYPAFQYLSNVDAPRSHQHFHVAPAPVAHPESVLKITMVAHQDPRELGVDGPSQSQQNDRQFQHFHRPQHHVPSCKVQKPITADSMWTPSAAIYSPFNTTTQCSSANENTAVHCRHQRHSYACHTVGTVALKDDTVGVTAQQNQYSQKIQPYTLLKAILKTGNLLSSTLTKVNIEPSARTNLSNERHCQSQKVRKCSLDIHNTQDPGYPSEHQQEVTSTTAVKQRFPPTDEEIQISIAKELEDSKRSLSSDRNARLPDTIASDKVKQCMGSVGQHTSATGHTPPASADLNWSCNYSRVTAASHSTENPQIMMEVAATWTKNEDAPGVLSSASAMPMIDLTRKAANGTHGAHNVLDVSWAPKPTVTIGYDNIHAITDVSVDECTKPSSVMSRNDVPLDINQDVSKKRENTEDVHCPVTDQEVVPHSKVKSSVDQIQILNVMSMSRDQGKQLWDLSSYEGVMDPGYMHSQTHFIPEPPEKRVQEPPPLSLESNRMPVQTTNFIKCSKYEDVSDDEVMPPVHTDVPNAEHKYFNIPVCHEKPTYEDISDDENHQMEHLDAETPLEEPNREQSQFENEGLVQMKEDISDDVCRERCSCPCFVETDSGFEQVRCPKCDSERRSVSCGSGNYSDGDETDDEMDDGYMVIPLSMADLKYDLDDESQDFPDNTGPDEEFQGTTAPEHCEAHCPAPETLPAPVSYQIEVFDTVASFLQSKSSMVGLPSERITPEHEMNSDTGEPQTPHCMRVSHAEPQDSSETEDSCDYSSESEHNYLTASRQVFKKRSVPDEDFSAVENENKPNKATSVQKGQNKDKLGCMQKLKELIKSKHIKSKTSRQKNSKAQGNFVDSDSDDESDYNCRTKVKLKRPSFSSSVDSLDAPSSQQTGYSHQTADSRSPQSGSDLHETCFKEVIKGVSSSGHFIENKADPKRVNHVANRKDISKDSIIIIDSDTEDLANTEDESDKKPKEESKAFPISSGLNNGNVPHFQQERHPCENESGSGPAQETFGRILSVGSSEMNNAQFNKGINSDCSYSTLSLKKSGRRLETVDGSGNIQDKTSQTIFNGSDNFTKKAASERLLTSVSKSHSRASCSVQNIGFAEKVDGLCGLGREKPQTRVQSSCDSSNGQQSVAQESSSCHNRLIPRLYVIEPADPRDRLKLVKKTVLHRQNKENNAVPKAPKVTSKETHPSDKNTQPLSLNKTQGNMTKPKQLSGRSLSNQEGGSIGGSLQSGEVDPKPHQSATKERTSVPKHNLTSSKLRHSFSYPSTSRLSLSNTRDQSLNAATQLSALERLKNDWSKSYYPTRRDRKTSMGTEEAVNTEPKREAHQPQSHPRQRRNSKECETSLMKRAKMEAVQLTKATNRNNSREQRGSVGEGYKWSERPKVERSKKGFIDRGEHRWSPSSND